MDSSQRSAQRSLSVLLERVHGRFVDRFGCEPEWGAVAPGRVNLIGDHTDYNRGFVLPLAIDRHTVVLASRADNAASTIFAAELNETAQADFAGPLRPEPGSFANYVFGVVQQFIARGALVPNMNVLIAGDLPRGAGLSSSASLEVATATLLEQVIGASLEPSEKALLCQRAEHAFANVPCGIMDMYVISMARARHAMLIDCRSNEHEHIPLPEADEAALLVIDCGVHRKLAAGEYQKRRQWCESAARKLGLNSLREATAEHIRESQLDDDECRAARHVVAENARVLHVADALRSRDLKKCGEAMFESHDSLRDDFQVSVPELDAIVESARQLRGQGRVWGARMTGAGFGGCAIVLCRPEAVEDVSAFIASEFRRRFKHALQIFVTTAESGARAIQVGV